jgi:hypothetical protein
MDINPKAAPAIEGQRLSAWSVLPGGNHVALGFAKDGGEQQCLVLPIDALTGLLMTLPRILQSALDQRAPGGVLRVVYPLAVWQLEQTEHDQSLILKLATTDGFEVAFAVQDDKANALGAALLTAPAEPATPSTWRVH